MKPDIFRVPISCLEFAVRLHKRFIEACQEIGVEFIDQLTPETIATLRKSLVDAGGVGDVSLREFDHVMSNIGSASKDAKEQYFGEFGKGRLDVIHRISELLIDGEQVPNEAVAVLLAAYKSKVKR